MPCPNNHTCAQYGLYARWYFRWRSNNAGLPPPIVKSNAIPRIYIAFYTLWLWLY